MGDLIFESALMRHMQDDDGFDQLYTAMKERRLVPSPEHPQTPPDDWMRYLWDDRVWCLRAKKELEEEVGLLEIWSLQDGEGAALYVEKGARYVDNLGWFVVRASRNSYNED